MALVKKSKIAGSDVRSAGLSTAGNGQPPKAPPPRASTTRPQTTKPQTAIERIAAATEELAAGLAEASAQIGGSVRAIERNSERQRASVQVISELELRAKDISEITQTVGRIE